MLNKIFKHYRGNLSEFKEYLASVDANQFINSITFIHPDDSLNSGWIFANGCYYTAVEVTGISAEELYKVIDGDSIGMEIIDGKLKLIPLLQKNISSNLQTAVGYIEKGIQSNIFTKGMTLDDVLKKIFCKILDYNYSFTNTFNLTGVITPAEVGSVYSPTISFTGNPIIKYIKPVGGSAAQTDTLLTADDYTVTYSFNDTNSAGTYLPTNSYIPSWTVTEGNKIFYGWVKVSNIATAASLDLKQSDDITASTTTISDQYIAKQQTVTGAYKVYYIVNTTTKLTADSTFNDCVSVLTKQSMLTNNITVLSSTATEIGTASVKKYVYVLIPSIKQTPGFEDGMGNPGTMVVINNSLQNQYGTNYKLCAINANGNAGDKYKNLIIRK